MNLKPCEDNLSTRATRFHPFVSLFETGRVDGTQVFSERRSQTTPVYHCRNFAKEFVLLNHVPGRRVSNVAENSAVERSHGICMLTPS
jgi:hypothetical protein